MCVGLNPAEGSNPSLSAILKLEMKTYPMRESKILLLIIAFISFGCSEGDLAKRDRKPQEVPLSEVNYPGVAPKPAPRLENSVLAEGSRTEVENHPEVTDGQKQQRAIQTPKEVEGKWKAVKFIIKDKQDEEKTEVKTVNLGESFVLAGSDLTVTVGVFFPNFVMDRVYYTSVGNEPTNPAVQFIVHEKDKRIFEGWAFKRFPKLYGFDHDRYEILLTDYIPMGVS